MFYQHWREVPKDAWRWNHFKPDEVASHGDGSLLVVEGALDTLERLRTLLGRPLVILSAYRDPVHNARVGGAPLSQHKFGKAFDLRLDYDRDMLVGLAKEAGFRGIGLYKTFVHVDCGPSRRWDNRGE